MRQDTNDSSTWLSAGKGFLSWLIRGETLFFGLIVATIMLSGCTTVGEMSEAEQREFEAQIIKEQEVGEAAFAKLVGQFGLVRNEEATEYLNKYLQSLAFYVERQELTYYAAILDTSQVNAFALPGGYILVTLGTLQHIEEPGELAGVLAHELGHVQKRHILENVSIEVEYSPAETLARLLAGGRQIVNTAVSQINDAIEERLFLEGYQADDEYEADAYAISLLQTLGISGEPYRDFLSRLAGESHGEEGNLANLDKTHPPLDERLRRIDEQLEPGLPRLSPTADFEAFIESVNALEATTATLTTEEAI